MKSVKAYEEFVDFISAGTTPESIVAYRPSRQVCLRVEHLIGKEKAGRLTEEEGTELEHYMEVEHLMRLAKARARKRLQDAD